MYRLFGWWYRWQACKMAAAVMSNHGIPSDEALAPLAWSLTVYFESYMVHGSDWTSEEFGPKAPVQLREVRSNEAIGP